MSIDIKQLEQDIKAYAEEVSHLGGLKAQKSALVEEFETEHAELFTEIKALDGRLKAREEELKAEIAQAAAAGAQFNKKAHGIEVQREVVIEITDDRAAIQWLIENDFDQFMDCDPVTGEPKLDADGNPQIVKLVTLHYPARTIAKIRPFALVGAIPWAIPHFEVPRVTFGTDLLKKWGNEPAVTVAEPEISLNPDGEAAKVTRRRGTHAGAEFDHTQGAGLDDDL